MRKTYVPVTLGSPRFRAVDVGGLRVTEAWFPPDLELPPHYHDRGCFAVVLDGSIDVRFAQRAHDCPPATIWTEPPGERHGNRADRAGAHVIVVQPDPHDVALRPFEPLWDGVQHFQSARITALAQRAGRELSKPDDLSELSLQSLALEMLVNSLRQRRPLRREPTLPRWLRRAQEYLHAHFQERVTLTTLASEAGVHPVHLSRVFRHRFGASIADYVRGLRLAWAAQQIADSALPLSTIALDAGFADQSHFTRAFGNQYGVTPARYRAAARSFSARPSPARRADPSS